MKKLLVCFLMTAVCALSRADSCIISGSIASTPASEKAAVGGVNSGGVAVWSLADALEARFCTWLFSVGIGLDPTLRPGVLVIFR